jgi:alkyl sulfatase BDS1-like metallo-beta-lactamase superfamily hydrolase
VADGIYQSRGFDMSNMTLVEGDQGVLVIDPLISRRSPRRRWPSTASTVATAP